MQDATGRRLRQPPVPMRHPDYGKFIDTARVMHLRLKQHAEIIK